MDKAKSICKTSESDSAVKRTTQSHNAKPLSQTQWWPGQRRINMQNLSVRLSGDLDNAVSICKTSESNSAVTWTVQSQYAKPLSQTHRWSGQRRVNMQISESDSAVTWTKQSQHAKPLSQTHHWPWQRSVNMQNLWVRLRGDMDNAESICKTSQSNSAVTWTTQRQYAKPQSQTHWWPWQRSVNVQNLWVRLRGDMDNSESICKTSESYSAVPWTT